MKKIFCLMVVLLQCRGRTVFCQSPGGVASNLTLWIKAGSGASPSSGGTLTGWTDMAGNNSFSLTSTGTGLTAPVVVLNGLNFNPVVRFTGSGTNGYRLLGNTSITMSDVSAVGSWTGPVTNERGTFFSPINNSGLNLISARYFFRSASGGQLYTGFGSIDAGLFAGYESATPPASTVPVVLTASGTGNVLNMNGLDARTGNIRGGYFTTTMTDIPQIADRSSSDSKMNGDIAEIVVYSAANSASLQNKVESYLAFKYGITLGNATSPISYTSSAGTVFWTGLAAYQHNIFGIGTDNGSGLVQTSSNSVNSGSGDGTGQSGLGNLVLKTSSALTNGQFLMVGTDSAVLTEETITAAIGPAAAIGSKRLVRTWKAQTTGAVSSVNLSFDMTGLTLSGASVAANYYLLIDNDGDGNFTTGAQTYVPASGISGSLISFSGTSALANGVVFTLITVPSTMLVLADRWQGFTASGAGSSVTLHWNTAPDLPIDYFNVYHSTDGATFIPIAQLPLTTVMPLAGMSYVVSERGEGTYFYRLRAVLKDGAENYSMIRSVKISASKRLKIHSNPVVGGELRLQFHASASESVIVSLFSASGSRQLTRIWSVAPGENLLTMDIHRLGEGLYFLRLDGSHGYETLDFVKSTGMK
ncbi:autotransporter outer membrane beta-barrel domain-containing protein [Niastella koreensis]|nr:hypothetical protein [Niastella koreensis]